jgi:choline kinase
MRRRWYQGEVGYAIWPEKVYAARQMSTQAAVILVAGLGSRLAPLTDDRPKALVDLGGESILQRAVRLLRHHGVGRVVLATGYRQDASERTAAGLGVEVVIVPNPDYATTQNSVSLALCADALRGQAFFKLDGDVVFDPTVLERLEAGEAPLVVAVDGRRELDEEAMKVLAAGDRITAFGKALPVEGSAGESIGIEWLSSEAGSVLFDRLRKAVAAGRTDAYYEDFYGELVAEGRLIAQAIEVGDLPWTEVDDLQDLALARSLVKQKLVEREGSLEPA